MLLIAIAWDILGQNAMADRRKFATPLQVSSATRRWRRTVRAVFNAEA
jgi:hypothetical protein